MADDSVTPGSIAQVPPDRGVELNIHQTVFEIQGTISSLATKVDRLIDDRKEDRQLLREDMREIKSGFREDAEKLRSDLKEFKKDEFKPLRDDVSNLRLKWAKVSGVAALIGGIMAVFGEIAVAAAKKFFHLG